MDEGSRNTIESAPGHRCQQCDSVIPSGSEVCLMCGAMVTKPVTEKSGEPISAVVGPTEVSDATSAAEAVSSTMRERQSKLVWWMTGVVFAITVVIGALVLKYGGPVQLALVPTATPVPSTPTLTPSATLPPTQTEPPSRTPTSTPPPPPTVTPQPPRSHTVAAGETLFGLSLFYNVSMESIADSNGFAVDSPIQANQVLQVPWPTPTPPLEAIMLDINGETVIADPAECDRYTIQEGDAISVIAARYNIDFVVLQQVNRLTDRSILQPGDSICIPEVIYGGVLPPTPGPSPTPAPTSFPEGPSLLYPADGALVTMENEPVVLQWVAVKDLAEDEWYMVEVTDVDIEQARPHRAFTRDNALRLSESWRPTVDAIHQLRWRVSIVRVTGQREDGGLIFEFGGRNSNDGYFRWQGAVPTPTPTPSPTPKPTSTQGP